MKKAFVPGLGRTGRFYPRRKFNSLLSCSLSRGQTCVVVPAGWHGVKIVVPAAGGGTEDDG
jgi:hypothetical protein